MHPMSMTFCETMDARPMLLCSAESKLSMGWTIHPTETRNSRQMQMSMCVDAGEHSVAAATKCMSSVAPMKDWFHRRKDGSPARPVFWATNSSCAAHAFFGA